jgi:VPDSG-CTERM motif
MKINLIPTKKLAMLSAAFCAAMLAFSPNAKALTFGDANDLGQVLFGIPSGDAARTTYVNTLIDLAPGTTGFHANGQTYNRSLANPGPGFPNYPNAVFALNGTGTTIDLGPTAGVFQYLFAKYDGPNAGSEVWYVGNLSGVITIPAVGLLGQNYGLSGWTLFTGTTHAFPDGGTTVMLLGAALGALGMARRFLKS